MANYLLQRLVSAILVLWVVITLTFILMHSIPGGPFTSERKAPKVILENLNARYHLDDPLYKQYWDYLKNLARFDLGPSLVYEGRTVNDLIKDGMPKTVAVGLLAAIFGIGGGLALGIGGALRQNKMPDVLATLLASIGISFPGFILATLIQYFVGYKLNLFPPVGWGEAKYVVLPALALSAYPLAQVTKLIRSSMLDVLSQDYIRTARSKGLPIHLILVRHALKNACLPVITYLGPFFAYILTGNFAIEYVFNIPGTGQWFVSSIADRDYPVIMGFTILYCTILVALNLLVDVVYTLVDPRIKLAGREGA